MTIRTAKRTDASSIAAISIEVWIGTYLKRGVSGFFADYALTTFTVAATEELLADPSQYVVVSENEEGIDGFIRVTFGNQDPIDGQSDTEIATFYVQPRHHGKGIGTRLMSAALQECRDRSAGSVWLTTNAENDPAIGYYLAHGFEQIGETHFRIADQGYLNNVYRFTLL